YPPKAWLDEPVAGTAWTPEDTTSVEDKPVEKDVWQRRYEALVEALRDEAESRGWCDEYEDFVSEHGVVGGEREKDYDVSVTMTSSLNMSTLDDALRSYLNTEDRDVDVRTDIEVEHRATVEVSTTRSALRNGDANDLIEERLRSEGWQFESITVDDYEPA